MRGYDITQLIWTLIYCLNICVLFISIATLAISAFPRKYSTIEKTTIGIGILPYLLGIWMIAISFLPQFFGKQYFSIAVPFILAVINLIINRKTLAATAAELFRFFKEKTVYASCFVILVGGLAAICIYYISGYMGHTDAGFYTAEALQFSRSLSFHDISTHVDSATYLNGSVHNFVWPAYISYGMMFSSLGEFGLHYDLAMFIGMRILPALVLCMFGIMCYEVSGRNGMGMIIGMVLFCMTPMQNIICGYSRDFFRLIPLMLMIVVMNRELQTQNDKIKKADIIICALIGFMVPSGHPINAFSALSIGIAWLGLHIVQKREVKEAIKYTAALVGGFLIGAYNIIYAFIMTGEIDGNCSLYIDNIAEGTDLGEIYLSNMEATTSRGLSLLATVKKIFSMDQYGIIIICTVIVAITILLIAMRKKQKAVNWFHIAVLLTALLMIFAGHFVGWGSFRYDEWLARNSRYSFHFYFMAILALISVFPWIKKAFDKNTAVRVLTSLGIICILMTFPGKVESDNNLMAYFLERETTTVRTVVDEINSVIEKAGNKEVWITQTDFAYDTGLRANLLTSYYGQELFHAQTEDDVREFLESNNLEFLCFERNYLSWLFDKTHFYQLLAQMDGITEYSSNENLVIFRYIGEK